MRDLDPGDPARLGEYRLLRVIGVGGMGKVFLGRRTTDGLYAAVKIVSDPRAHGDEARDRIRQEIESIMRLGGVHTARVRAFDIDHDPPWLAIDYLKAPTLQELVAETGALPVPAVLSMARRLAVALRHLRSRSIVHRDIKPSNIIMDASEPKLIDFGIAKELGHESIYSSGRKGTPGYMSPEQAIGGALLTHATDVYSLGVTIAFAATGRHPQLTATDMIVRDADGRARFDGLPEVLGELVAACTRVRAGDRIDAEAVIAACEPADTEHANAAPAGATPTPGEPSPAARLRTGAPPGPRRAAGRDLAPLPPRALAALPSRAVRVLRDYAERPTDARPVVTPLPEVTARVPGRAPDGGDGSGPAGPTEPRWRVRLGGNGYYASPVLAEDPATGRTVLCAGGHDGLLRAFDPADGRELWSSRRCGRIERTPAVHDGTVYFPCSGGWVHALSVGDGSVRWRVETAPSAGTEPVVVPAAGALVLGDVSGLVRALDLDGGKELWRFRTANTVAGPVAAAGTLVHAASWDHHLYALRADTGSEVWRYDTGAAIAAAPVRAGDLVLCGTVDGAVHAVDAHRPVRRWTFRAERAVHALTATPDVAYIGSDDHRVYAIDVADGQGMWTFTAGGPVRAAPLVHGDRVFAGSHDHTLYALDTLSGAERGRFAAGEWVDSSPVTDGTSLFAGDWGCRLAAIDLAALSAGRRR
ncbi:PQQ-binding-like beta-propeller repeat protein [Actinomadura sp. WMMB 499]|uniref:outer membrane protein assembly factor BamB family protein n=1 Tax=Actinomadura sp. WMMB 499 TaxID=1219491 RepID=UPI001246074F|nr:PQQ-binding-like beta-propeller repeat protein [Actinomadura sp. WMMB 499]QFG22989.1 PQQ-binding-like beta-propeller repeat protein [Actinomadura sp. WMMB 499]